MTDNVSMREACGRALVDYGDTNKDFVVLDADTSASTYSSFFAKKYPERFFNVGIAEPCMVDVAVGFALAGRVPFVNAFAALLALRALEQVRTNVAYARTNVKLVAHYAGLSAFKDGPTHHAITDLAVMRSLPNMTVIVPADAVETASWIPVLAEYDGPVYFRLSRAVTIPVHREPPQLKIGRGLRLRPGADVTIACCGSLVGYSMQAADALATKGIQARVIEMHTLKPFDEDLLLQAADETGAVVTAEEHTIIGGLGGAVAEILGKFKPVPLETVGIPDTFACTALSPEALMDAFGLGVADIVTAAERAIRRKAA